MQGYWSRRARDKVLLELGKHDGVKIVSLRAYLKR